MDGNERKINTFYAGQIRYRSIIEVSSDHGIGGSSFIGVFRRNRGEHAFIYFRLGSRDLLLFSDIFKKCTEAVRRKSGISYENIQDKKLVSESKKLDVACIDVHGNAVPTIIKIAQKIEIDFLFII